MNGVISSMKVSIHPEDKRKFSDFDNAYFKNLLPKLEHKDDPSRNPALPIVSVNVLFIFFITELVVILVIVHLIRKIIAYLVIFFYNILNVSYLNQVFRPIYSYKKNKY